MTGSVVEPGRVVGMLGGGQLGAMFAATARRMGYRVAVWDPDRDAPAHRWADHSFASAFDDDETYDRFANLVGVVTYEWENIPIGLCERLEEDGPVRPAARILRVVQDRIEQKSFLHAQGFPVAAFSIMTSPEQLGRLGELGYPCICKTATAGYDGKGQWKIAGEEDLRLVQTALHAAARPGSRWIVEKFLDFERELSLMVVRGVRGEVRVYPLAENLHEDGILRRTAVPAAVSAGVAAEATALAERLVSALGGVGVFCLELFLMKNGDLLINEVAPRPHNSGHYTLDACTVSQFEQQARAVCGLPLGEVRLLSPAAMINLIGDEVERLCAESDLSELLAVPGAVPHLYGKRTVRARRKMGHVTFVAPLLETAVARADAFRSRLARFAPDSVKQS
ncbi:MAG TPA: 5-(carboxyamino)imidazole ribonucleotide synthase [Nitrospiraceae bacterium]|nr:5-(carboxyamino)imidazole ribonucleotide synthase [Nitrospiraceae bacterium]